MKGFISKALTAACLLGGVLSMGGCYGYRNLVDPCYPERYEFAARREVVEAFAPQVHNGHILDQTVWNYHFESDENQVGTDHLTAGGMEHLAYLARRRPAPDTTIYVQTAQDLPYDPNYPERFVEKRSHLDALRVEAVQKYLNSYTAGRNLNFTVCLHDPAEVGMSAIPMRGSITLLHSSSQGVMAAGGRGTGATSNTQTTITSAPAGSSATPGATAGGP